MKYSFPRQVPLLIWLESRTEICDSSVRRRTRTDSKREKSVSGISQCYRQPGMRFIGRKGDSFLQSLWQGRGCLTNKGGETSGCGGIGCTVWRQAWDLQSVCWEKNLWTGRSGWDSIQFEDTDYGFGEERKKSAVAFVSVSCAFCRGRTVWCAAGDTDSQRDRYKKRIISCRFVYRSRLQ